MDRANWNLIIIIVVAVLSLQFGLWVAGRRWRRDPAYRHHSSCLGDTLSLLVGLVWIAIGAWLLFVGWNTYREDRSGSSNPGSDSLATADVYASILVYDASIGLDALISGATTSLCSWPTGDDGRTRCPWQVGPVPQDWWEAFQDGQRTVTVTAAAPGFQTATVVVHASAAQDPEFSIGLWPLDPAATTGDSTGDQAPPAQEEVVASLYASLYVYDAAVGPEAPIAGARTSLCETPTNRRGKVACPWLVAIVSADWWESNQGVVRPLTITVQAESFQPTTVITQAAVTRAPRFDIGLWSQDAAPPAGDLGGEALVANGDFSQGLKSWEIIQSENCDHCWVEVQAGDSGHRHLLAWKRTQGGAAGGAIWARQTLNRDLGDCNRLVLSFDVRVDAHSLPNSGWWSEQRGGSGEYPVKVNLAFLSEREERFGWSHGYLYEHDGSTSLSNYTQAPRGRWITVQTDLLAPAQWLDPQGRPLPRPMTLQEILIGGNGWDFAGAITNLQLTCLDSRPQVHSQ